MGRLAHLQSTLPVLLEGPVDVVVVDYSCPNASGAWVSTNYNQTGRVLVESIPGRSAFNKPEAHNRGAARAASWRPGAYLCFLDADSIVMPTLWGWLVPRLRPDRFYFVEGWPDQPDVTGALVVHSNAFRASGGFDERMKGWGAEDLDMRLRLRYRVGLPFEEIPVSHIRAIPHSDEARVDNYVVKNKHVTHYRNLWIMADNFRKWTGRDLRSTQCERDMWKMLGVFQWWQQMIARQRAAGMRPVC